MTRCCLSCNPSEFRSRRSCALCRSCLSLAQRSCPASPSRCLSAFIVGPLGLGSPRVRNFVFSDSAPAVLRVATTAFVLPGWFAFRSLPVPSGLRRFGFVSSSRRTGNARVLAGCWLSRSPVLRLSLPRRREGLPSSRFTPLSTCPALRPRWGPARSPWRAQDCCLPVTGHSRLWVRLPELILCPPLYIFRGSITRPAPSPGLCFGHRLSAVALRFGY